MQQRPIFRARRVIADKHTTIAASETVESKQKPVVHAADLKPTAPVQLPNRSWTAFDVLADALLVFSLDLVKIVFGYLVFPPATAGAKPKLLLTFGSEGDADGQFKIGCCGVACSPDNKIWVSSKDKVSVFSDDGKFLHLVAGEWLFARGICFSDSEAFIADQCAHCIVVCGLDGSYVRRIGSKGEGNGQFNEPHDVAVYRKNQLAFVSDTGNLRVSVLKLDGSFVRTFGLKGSGDKSYPGRPCCIAVNANGVVAVTDNYYHRVQVSRRCCHCVLCTFDRCSTPMASFCANSANSAKRIDSLRIRVV